MFQELADFEKCPDGPKLTAESKFNIYTVVTNRECIALFSDLSNLLYCIFDK